MWQYKDSTCERIETMLIPAQVIPQPTTINDPGGDYSKPRKMIKAYHRQAIFPTKILESDADIDAYVENVRSHLKQLIKDCDGIKIN